MTHKLFLFLLFNFFAFSISAQKEIIGMGVRSSVIEVKNGRNHFVHTVKKQETLYSISKTYHIPMQDIAAANEKTLVRLNQGQQIIIPAQPISPEDEGAKYFFFFVADQDMSLYKASQHYKFQISDFLKINPKASKGISKGQIIKVPKERTVVTETIEKDTADVDLPVKIDFRKSCMEFVYDKSQHTFRVALLLPLFLNKNESALRLPESSLEHAKFNPHTSRFVNYLQGVLMAADQLRKEGVNVELNIYDTENDSTRIARLLSMGVVDEVDLVVGPVFSKHFTTVSKHLEGKNINLVSPLSKNTRLISNNDNSYLLTPSDKTLFESLSYLAAKQQPKNIILLHNGSRKETEYSGVFKAQFSKTISTDTSNYRPNFQMINYKMGGSKAVKRALNADENNLVIIPSNKEVFVTDLVAKMKVMSLKYPITLIGLDIWENFENINLSNLHSLHLHYSTNIFVNYDNPRVLAFVQNFRFMFRAEPSRFAFQGYDALLFFGQALKRYGKNFNYCLNESGITPNRLGLSTEWNFKKLDEFSGSENKTTYVVEYCDEAEIKVHKVILNNGQVVDEKIIVEDKKEE